MELQDAPRVGVPPAVDELVVVADHEELAAGARQHVHECQLGAVEVLELVHEDVLELLLHEAPAAGIGEQVHDGEVDLVVERLTPGRPLGAQVALVRLRERQGEQRLVACGVDGDLHRGGILERCPHAREAVEEGAHRVTPAGRLDAGRRDARGLHGAPHEGAQPGAVEVHADARSHHLALVAVAERVEGGAVHAGGCGCVAPAPHTPELLRASETARGGDAERREPLLELLGRFAVEREQQDGGRVGAAPHELVHAADKRLGLAGAGGSEHPRRPAAVPDRGTLGGVQPGGVRAARQRARGDRGAAPLDARRAPQTRTWRDRRRCPGAEQVPDVLNVQQRSPREVEGARGERLRLEREADAVRQAAAYERVHEAQQDGARLGGELLCRAVPQPQPDGRLAAPAQARRRGLAGVLGPRPSPRETPLRSGCGGVPCKLASARHLEEHEPWPCALRGATRAPRISVTVHAPHGSDSKCRARG